MNSWKTHAWETMPDSIQSMCVLCVVLRQNNCGFVVTGESMTEAMKNSPHNGPGTPREDMPPASVPPGSGDMGPYPNMPYQDNNPNNPMNNPVNVNNVSMLCNEVRKVKKYC